MISVAVGINADPVRQGQGARRDGRRRARHRHRPRPPDRACSRSSSRCAPPSPGTPIVAGNVVTADGHASADRGRCRHRQGRRRTRRDVHDADDDRRRPAAVLGRRRVRGRGGPARQAHLGRRRRALPARRRPGARRRRGERDVRVVARRHVRVGRRHAARPRRPALQGELRDGVEPRREEPHPGRDRARAGAQGAVRGGHQHARGCTSTRSARASRTSSTRSSPASARRARTPARRRSPSSTNGPSSACRATPATTRVVRSGRAGDRRPDRDGPDDEPPMTGPVVIAIDGPAGAGKSTVGRAARPPPRARVPRHRRDVPGRHVRRAAPRDPGRTTPTRSPSSLARSRSTSTTTVSVDGVDATVGDPRARGHRGGQRRSRPTRACAPSSSNASGRGRERVAAASSRAATSARSCSPTRALKLYVTASPRVRAERRVGEIGGDVDEVEAAIVERDRRDSTRADSPLARGRRRGRRRHERA